MKYLAYASMLVWAVVIVMNFTSYNPMAKERVSQEQVSSSPAMKTAAVSAPQYSDDGSLLLPLSTSDRDHIRGEMREFLIGLQALTEAIAKEDRVRIAEAAAGMGRKRGDPHHREIMQRTPQEFRFMGRIVREGFEDIAAMAQTAPMSDLLDRLSVNISHCASCHATWRVGEASAN